MNFSALARIPFQAVGEFWDVLCPREKSEGRRLEAYSDALSAREAEEEVFAPGALFDAADETDGAGYLSWGVDGATTNPGLDEPELMAFGIASAAEWMQENRRTDVRIQCGHCLESVGGFTDFAKHMLTCTLTPTSPGVPPPGAGLGEEVEPSLPPIAAPSSSGSDLTDLIEDVLSEHHDTRELQLDGTKSYLCECDCVAASAAGHRAHLAVLIAERIEANSPPAPFTFGDLSRASSYIRAYAERIEASGGDGTVMRGVADRLGDAADIDVSP